MKTNVNMVRTMGTFEVVQRTKDGMFNATGLLKQWNEHSGMKKEVKDFFTNKQTSEFIDVLIKEENLDGGNSPYLKTRGRNGGTWMHPFLFIKFAMWLNPRFEYQVIKFVYDELIKYRHDAGDYYKSFCKSITKIYPNCDFSEPAKWLNFVVFNSHKKDIRNEATEEQLQELSKLEKKYSDLINEGYIKGVVTLKEKLRSEWRNRHLGMPAILQ